MGLLQSLRLVRRCDWFSHCDSFTRLFGHCDCFVIATCSVIAIVWSLRPVWSLPLALVVCASCLEDLGAALLGRGGLVSLAYHASRPVAAQLPTSSRKARPLLQCRPSS
eukprot:16428117-Heterocapsa_arctica.AAC.1